MAEATALDAPVRLRAAWTLADFPRLERLRQALLEAPKSICAERPRLLTDYFRRRGFDERRPVLRQAKALAHLLAHLPTPIFDDELIVGSTTRHRLGCLIYPEFLGLSIWPELPTLADRDFDPVAVDQVDADLLAEEVFPFWRDRMVHEHARREGDEPESLRLAERMYFYSLAKSNGLSHIIPDHPSLVTRGLDALKARAAEAGRAAADAQAAEFHRAVQVAIDGVLALAARYAHACRALAERAVAHRAAELERIASILDRVPARPARTLHEALQAIWITQVALCQENSDLALSFGRLDQFLGPLLEADLAAGRLTEVQAAELIGCFFVKMNDHTPLVPATGQELFGGSPTGQAVTLGGLTPDGRDGVNRATHLMLEMSRLLRLREPNVGARIHRGSDPDYRAALVQAIYDSGAAPALYGDEAIVEALTAHGCGREDARDYGVIGCVETRSCGRSMGHTGAILFNLAAALELALNDGIHPGSRQRVGPATGRLVDFDDYPAFLAAFDRQLAHLVDLAVDGNRRLAAAHARLHPSPLLSALIQGTCEAGRDVTQGGARYSTSGMTVIGLADVADSLTVLRELVFDQGRISPAEMAAALADDFQGHPRVQAMVSRLAPKYGVDDPRADDTAADLVERIGRVVARHRNPTGGPYLVGYWSITMHAGLGALTGALPSGRRRAAPLASGATPVSGAARSGPTAALASSRSLPARRMPNCMANNHKIARSLLGRPGRLNIFQRLVDGFFEGGGMQVQFTVQDRQTLVAAQRNPGRYRDLLVRVSGYTAYFCDLNRRMQDEIISRTEDEF